jgi:putative ABC transport system permease protein
VQNFGANAFVAVRPEPAAPETAWNRHQVEVLQANLGRGARVSGVHVQEPVAEVEWPVVAADAGLAGVRGWRIVAGRFLDGLDVRQGAAHAMAPVELCRSRGWRVGDSIPLGWQVVRLIGSFDPGGATIPGVPENAVYVPHTADVFMPREEAEIGRVGILLFCAQNGVDPEGVRRRAAALLSQPGLGGGGEITWITPESLLQGIRGWQRAIAWTAGAGGALALLLGAVTLAGMLLTGIRERITEIGLRRALGARRREIAGLFVAESVVLSGAAALAGLLAAEGTLRGLGGRFPLPFHFSLGVRLLPVALAGGLALVCSIGPAWLAARLPPAEALRNE